MTIGELINKLESIAASQPEGKTLPFVIKEERAYCKSGCCTELMDIDISEDDIEVRLELESSLTEGRELRRVVAL
jgi:hypothetical protein